MKVSIRLPFQEAKLQHQELIPSSISGSLGSLFPNFVVPVVQHSLGKAEYPCRDGLPWPGETPEASLDLPQLPRSPPGPSALGHGGTFSKSPSPLCLWLKEEAQPLLITPF